MGSLLNIMYTEAETVEYAFAGLFMAFFILFVVLLFIVAIVAAILGIIGQWKMFEKAKEKGWKSLIPVYNLYTMCKVTGVNPWWIVVSIVVAIVSAVFNSVSTSYPDAWGLTIFVILFGLLNFAVSIYFAIIMAVSTARSYGKESGWAVGLYFLKPFFMFALGIGKSKYVGATPMKDPILGGSTNKNTTKKGKFCPECGKEIEASSKFCPHCGTKI